MSSRGCPIFSHAEGKSPWQPDNWSGHGCNDDGLAGWKKNGKKGVGLAREVGPKHIGVSERGYVTCLLSPEI